MPGHTQTSLSRLSGREDLPLHPHPSVTSETPGVAVNVQTGWEVETEQESFVGNAEWRGPAAFLNKIPQGFPELSRVRDTAFCWPQCTAGEFTHVPSHAIPTSLSILWQTRKHICPPSWSPHLISTYVKKLCISGLG